MNIMKMNKKDVVWKMEVVCVYTRIWYIRFQNKIGEIELRTQRSKKQALQKADEFIDAFGLNVDGYNKE